jgi:hypothetical protein
MTSHLERMVSGTETMLLGPDFIASGRETPGLPGGSHAHWDRDNALWLDCMDSDQETMFRERELMVSGQEVIVSNSQVIAF